MHSIISILIILISVRYTIQSSGCQTEGTLLTCTNLNLRNTTDFPVNNIQNIVEIKFKTSIIPIISSGMFARFSDVRTLTIDVAGIETIEPAGFTGMDHLTQIHFHGNKISDLQPGTINSIHTLEKLYLLHNRLTKIEKHYFSNLINLTFLDLDSNLLEELSDDAFEDLINLLMLHLRHNRLKYISADCFKNLKALHTLHLQSNLLKNFESGLFRNLHSLIFLNVGLNNLTEINECSLLPLHNLETFAVYNNTLTHLNQNILLTALPKLKTVYMNNNLWYCSSLTNTLIAFIKRGMVLEYNSTTTRNVLGISCVNGSVPDSIANNLSLTMEDCLIFTNKTHNTSINPILNITRIPSNVSADLFANEIINNKNGTRLFGSLGRNESMPGYEKGFPLNNSVANDLNSMRTAISGILGRNEFVPDSIIDESRTGKGFALKNNTDNNSNNDFIEIVYNTMFRFRTSKKMKNFQD